MLKQLRHEQAQEVLNILGDAAALLDQNIKHQKEYARWVRYFLVALDDEDESTREF